MHRIYSCLVLLCALACPAGAQAPKCNPSDLAPFTGQAAAIDGDTLAVIVDGRRSPNIRLHAIDAPELRNATKVESPAGMQSRATMADLVNGKPVKVQPVECDAYGRTVATVDAAGADVSLAMVRAGMAYTFVHYAMRPDMMERFNALQAAEYEARERRVGLWAVWLSKP